MTSDHGPARTAPDRGPSRDFQAAGPAGERRRTFFNRSEDALVIACLALMTLLPMVEMLGRGVEIPSTIVLVQKLTLWVALLGAGIAAREGRHLTLSHLPDRLRGRLAVAGRIAAAVAGGAVAALLAWASVVFLRQGLMDSHERVWGLPEWFWALPLLAGFAIVAVRQVHHASLTSWGPRLGAAALVAAVIAAAFLFPGLRAAAVWPGIAALVVATVFGAPLFSLLGGAAILFFLGEGVPIASIPDATYGFVVNPTLPTIPLFTLAGFVLAEGGASRRLVGVFRSVFGWLPGGLAIGAACVCAFFTTFTGGSGVTILALGGLLLPALVQAGYRERYSMGLLTASGSLGLLFPPSLPVILYAVVAKTPIDRLFAGAILPGLILLGVVALTGVRESVRTGAGRAPFVAAEARAALWQAKWELALPVLVLFGMFAGVMTYVETAAATALYAVVVEVVVHRDLSWRRLPGVVVTTATLVGGVLLIFGVALGLTSYLVDAQVPAQAAAYVQATITSRTGFLLALNVFLLVVGSLMDIFSAIVVVVPLLQPMAEAYHIDPVHLGVIFLANIELGFLHPPVGLNLLLASYRFGRPVLEVTLATLPFLVLLLLAVLLITYVPGLTALGVALLAR